MSSGKQVFQAVRLTVVARIVSMSLQGLASVILGRVLMISDYGIVNFSNIIIGFLARFNDMGIENAIIQRQELKRETLSTAFILKMGMALFLTAILFISASSISTSFNMPGAAPVIRVLSLNFCLLSLAFLPTVLLRKEMKFSKVSIVWMVSAAVNAIIGVSLALGGAGYWSLAIAQLAGSATTVVVALILRPVSWRLDYSASEARSLLKIGGRVFAAGMLVFLSFNIDNFLIGAVAGPVALGLYGLAFNWSTLLCSFVSGTVHTVLFPAFANIQGDRKVVKLMYLKSVRYMGLVAALGYAVLAFVSSEFLIEVLGRGTTKWAAAIPVLQILCLYGILRQLLEPLGGALLAIGRADLLWRSAALVFVTELAGVYSALHFGYGITGVAAVVTFAYALQFVYFAPYVSNVLGVSYREFFGAMRPALASFVVVAGVGVFVNTPSSWYMLFLKAGAAALAVLPLYWLFGGKLEILEVRHRLAQVRAG